MRDLNGSTPEQRLHAGRMLLNISDISEDEQSPLHNASAAERDAAIREVGDAHQWVQQICQNRRMQGAAS